MHRTVSTVVYSEHSSVQCSTASMQCMAACSAVSSIWYSAVTTVVHRAVQYDEYSIMQCSSVQHSAAQCSGYSSIQCGAVSTVVYSTVRTPDSGRESMDMASRTRLAI